MPVHLHIEHLVIEGAPFAASDSRAFRAALERELAAKSVEMESRPWSSVRRASIHAPEISPAAPASLHSWAASSAGSLLAAIAPVSH